MFTTMVGVNEEHRNNSYYHRIFDTVSRKQWFKLVPDSAFCAGFSVQTSADTVHRISLNTCSRPRRYSVLKSMN